MRADEAAVTWHGKFVLDSAACCVWNGQVMEPSSTLGVTPPPLPPLPQGPAFPPPENWAARNWRWLIPLAVLVMAGAIGGCVLFMHMMKTAEPVLNEAKAAAISRASADPRTETAFGLPLSGDSISSWRVNWNGASRSVTMVILVSGPKG